MGIKFSLYQMVSVRIKRADSHKELSLVSDIIYVQINVSNYDKNNYPHNSDFRLLFASTVFKC